MMIQLKDVLDRYGIKPRGVIHVGAHWAQEHEDYVSMGIDYAVYIEPSKKSFEVLLNKFGGKRSGDHNGCHVVLYNYACAATYMGFQEMNVSPFNQGQSNSLLKPSLHLQQHPEVLFTETEMVEVQALDNMVFDYDRCNILVADVQGYELEVLKGAKSKLKRSDAVYLEVNRGETYSGNAMIEDVDYFLLQNDFERVETYWPSPNWTWGDAVYIHKRYINEIN